MYHAAFVASSVPLIKHLDQRYLGFFFFLISSNVISVSGIVFVLPGLKLLTVFTLFTLDGVNYFMEKYSYAHRPILVVPDPSLLKCFQEFISIYTSCFVFKSFELILSNQQYHRAFSGPQGKQRIVAL